MEDKNTLKEERIKNSFLIVKEEINSLKNELERTKNKLFNQKEIILALNKKINELLNENEELKKELNKNNISSTGNEGVMHSFIHSFNSYSDKQINKQINIQTFKESFDNMFKSLPRQEFLTFLTIYQLEDDLKRPINYLDISSHLKLSEGCIRTYISNLLKRKLPLTKTKVNNKLVQLQINSHFRELNLKQKLISLYELSNLDQKTLSDPF
ncbi:MAG: hypothetical protein V1663_04620 [archaeon]